MSQPRYVTTASWKRLKGQTDWKNSKPGGALVHVPCGRTEIICKSQIRSVWEERCPGGAGGSGQTVEVGELYCPKCHSEPNTNQGAPIQEDDYFAPGG
jgi:hypothetical protein